MSDALKEMLNPEFARLKVLLADSRAEIAAFPLLHKSAPVRYAAYEPALVTAVLHPAPVRVNHGLPLIHILFPPIPYEMITCHNNNRTAYPVLYFIPQILGAEI